MTAIQWFAFVALPCVIAALGVLVTELFIWRQRTQFAAETAAQRDTRGLAGTLAEVEKEVSWVLRLSEAEAMGFRLFARRKVFSGEIQRLYGNTSVSTLRRVFGENFAAGIPSDMRLREIWEKLDPASVSLLIDGYEQGKLEQVTRPAL